MLKNIFIFYHFFDNSKSKFPSNKIPFKKSYLQPHKLFRNIFKLFIYWRKILEYGSFRNIILRNQESIITPISRKFTDPSSKLYQIVVNENAVITRHSNKIKLVKSGIEYYFVEVTSKNGVQYGIPAFGAEAFETLCPNRVANKCTRFNITKSKIDSRNKLIVQMMQIIIRFQLPILKFSKNSTF